MKLSFPKLLLLAALFPLSAAASDLSYNHAEAGVALYPGSDNEQDFVGFDSRLSLELTPAVFVYGGLKFLTDEVDYTALHAGVGFRHRLETRTSIWGGVGLDYQELDFPNRAGTFDDTGLALRGGLRHQVNEALELGGSARVITGDLDYVGYAFTGRLALSRDLSLLGELDVFDGELGLIAGLSLSF
ncbi:MAG: hypothetical protein R3296_11020 [Oleiphilaceae bacterium]|nr:hypothetical protein [Oleiphilaceae bacterium]